MAESAIASFGVPIDAHCAFPSPESFLHATETKLRTDLGCGFRARYLQDLAKKATNNRRFYLGTSWMPASSYVFAAELSSVLGMGPVSVSYIARMYGKPRGFAIDSYVIRRAKELWGANGDLSTFLAYRYKALGDFAPLALWFDLTKHWDNTIPKKQEDF